MKRESKHQALRNGEVHSWYRFVMAYPDHLVQRIIQKLDVPKGAILLDPFCGTGTTLVECKKLGMESIGIDANPASVFASRVKTNWHLDPRILKELLSQVMRRLQAMDQAGKTAVGLGCHLENPLLPEIADVEDDVTVRYLRSSGMIKRGWISEPLLLETVLLKRVVGDVATCEEHRDFLLLGLVALVVEKVANIKFGPEVYCVKPRMLKSMMNIYEEKVSSMIADLEKVQEAYDGTPSRVLLGDSRECSSILYASGINHIDFVITSPPYPTEHDYTRNTRLELAYLGYVDSAKSLERIKRSMLRSNSKGVYNDDDDGVNVKGIPEVQDIIEELQEKAMVKRYAFAQRYPLVISHYFGGMHRHLRDISCVLSESARCAYVLGDQCSYLKTFIPTADIVAKIAQLPEIGFHVDAIETWRTRRGSTGDTDLDEKILYLSKVRKIRQDIGQLQTCTVMTQWPEEYKKAG